MHNPVLSTRSLSHEPAPNIKVLLNPADPVMLPMIVLHTPVVLHCPDELPMKILHEPVVLYCPDELPMNTF